MMTIWKFHNYTGGIIDYPQPDDQHITHIVSIVGWGEEHGKKYWIIRNSFGSYWGEEGFFRIVMGKNALLLEEGHCSYAVPKDTWTTDERNKTKIS